MTTVYVDEDYVDILACHAVTLVPCATLSPKVCRQYETWLAESPEYQSENMVVICRGGGNASGYSASEVLHALCT